MKKIICVGLCLRIISSIILFLILCHSTLKINFWPIIFQLPSGPTIIPSTHVHQLFLVPQFHHEEVHAKFTAILTTRIY